MSSESMYIFGCSSTNMFMSDLDYYDFRDVVCRLISFNVDLCFRIMSKCGIVANLFNAYRHWHTALKTNSEQRIWIWFKSSNGSRQTQSSEDIILTDLFRENPRTKFEDVYLSKMHSDIWMWEMELFKYVDLNITSTQFRTPRSECEKWNDVNEIIVNIGNINNNCNIIDIIMHSEIWMWEIIILIYSELWVLFLNHGI